MTDYEKYISKTAKNIPPSGIRKFFDIVKDYDDAISLGVGEPDFPTPWAARDAAIKSINAGYTQYTSNSGLMELRELACRYFKGRFNLTYDPKDEIIVTAGASEAIFLALRAFINDGDEVIVPDPSYVSYAPSITLCGGVPVSLQCFEKDNFKITPENLKKAISDKTKIIIMPFPNNPTGAVMEREKLEEISEILIKNDILVISDEIYAELTYGFRHFSIAAVKGMRERTIVISGMSKAFAMTGWRVGFLFAPREFMSPMLKIHQYIIMCAPSVSQFASCAALKSAISEDFKSIENMRNQYDIRRRFLVSELNDMGLSCFEPKGAFYVFPCVKSLGMNGEEFATRLLESQSVAVVPGSAFGNSGNDFVRISYAYSMKSLERAITRIKKFICDIK